MNPDRQQALEYLRAPAESVWRWAEHGAVLTWCDGTTIAFRDEVRQVLEWLAPNGLPPFGAIVFLLAACRGKVPAVADIAVESNAPVPPGLRGNTALLLTARLQLCAQVESALAELAKVAQLPAGLKAGLKAKCVLAEAVFEPARAERHVEARAVLEGLRQPLTDVELYDPDRPGVSGNAIRQIHIVAQGLKRHTAESLALRLRTGLDAMPGKIEVSLPPADRARRLIEQLSRDRDLGVVARAARDLMAAVRLPRRLGDRDPLAVGGVAGITNRGPLDRLLLSELAHDDLTLAARVALNEALYLRREPPMREPPGTLDLLLDSGVRLWGVPRVLGTAVALALIACDKQHREVRAWRAHGNVLQPVNLLARHGLVQHLGALEVEAQPAEAVPAFAQAVSSDAHSQSVLITHRDALADPALRRALADHPAAPGFVATVDRGGRFELHALPLSHRPPLCAAELDLKAVFDEPVGVPPIRNGMATDRPAIFGVTPFPFLLPLTGRLDYWITAADGFTYAVVNERRLVQFRDSRSGARVLTAELPSTRTLWMDSTEGAVHVVKAKAGPHPARLLTLKLPDEPLRVMELPGQSKLLAVHRYGDVILAIHGAEVCAHALSDGRLLARTSMEMPAWINGRFFRGPDAFHVAVWDGTRVKLEPVPVPKPFAMSDLAYIFDREGLEGPWFVHRDGLVFSSATEERHHLPAPPGLAPRLDSMRFSRDGHRILMAVLETRWRLVDLQSGETHRVMPGPKPPPMLDPPPLLPTWNLYRAIDAIARLPDGLALRGRKGRWYGLTFHRDGSLRISELPAPEIDALERVSFGEGLTTSHQGASLRMAVWSNGSKAFLDNRGLLHLMSPDPSRPEVSLVLSDGEVAGWTSDGQVCGPPFFFEDRLCPDAAEVMKRIMQLLHR